MFNKFYNLCAIQIRRIPLIKKYPTLKELIKYSLVGNFSNLIDFIFYIYLTRFFEVFYIHYLSTSIFTMLLASSIRFSLHKHWTFKDSDTRVYWQYLKLVITLALCVAIGAIILYIAVEKFGLNDILSKIIGELVAALNSYILTKYWVFSRRRHI